MILKDIRVARNLDVDTSGYIRFGQDSTTKNWRLGVVSGGDLYFYNSTSSPATNLGTAQLILANSTGNATLTSGNLSAAALTNFTLSAGSSGASFVLQQGTNGGTIFTAVGTGDHTLTTGAITSRGVIINSTSTLGSAIEFRKSGSAFGVIGTSAQWIGGTSTDFTLAAISALRFYSNNSGTEGMRLSTGANLLIGGTTDISGSGGLKVFGTTASTSTTSGALQVAGGIGIAGAGYFGSLVSSSLTGPTTTDLTLTGGSSGASLVLGQGTSGSVTLQGGTGARNVTIYAGAASASQSSITMFGANTATNMDYGQINLVQGNRFDIITGANGTGTARSIILQSGSSSKLTLGNTGTSTLENANLSITNTTVSTSTTSGALQVAGGIGVAGSGYFGSLVNSDTLGVLNAVTFANGPMTMSNGRQFQQQWSSTYLRIYDGSSGNYPYTINAGATSAGNVTIGYTTASSSTSTGALVVSGGIGAAGAVWIGGAYSSTTSAGLNLSGMSIPAITLQTSNASGRNFMVASNYAANGTLSITGSSTAGGAATVELLRFDPTTSSVTVTPSTASTSTATGSLVVSGGAGFAGSVNVGGEYVRVAPSTSRGIIALGSSGSTYSVGIYRSASDMNPASDGNWLNVGGFDGVNVTAGNAVFGSQTKVIAVTSSAVSIPITTASTSTTTGALTVAGGIGVVGAAYFGAGIFSTSTATSTFGGNIQQDRSVNGPVFNLVQNQSTGTSATAYQNAANGAYQTAIEMPGTSFTTSGPRVANRGYVWSDGAGGMTVHAINGTLRFWTGNTGTERMTISNSSGDVAILSTTASTSTTNGSLAVSGGIGIAGAMNIAGQITTQSSIALNTSTANSCLIRGAYASTNGWLIGTGAAIGDGSTDATLGIYAYSGPIKLYASGTLAATLTNTSLTLAATTSSTSTTTGALVVSGGLGVAGRIYAGGDVTIPSGSSFQVTANDRLYISTGNAVLVTGGSNVFSTSSSQLTISPTTASASTTTGALVVSGGVGVAGAAYFGGNVWIGGAGNLAPATVDKYIGVSVTSTADFPAHVLSVTDGVKNVRGSQYIDASTTQERWIWDVGYSSASNVSYEWRISGSQKMLLRETGGLSISDTTASTSTTTGALIVSGGVGVAGAGYFGSDLTVINSTSAILKLDQTGTRSWTFTASGGTLSLGTSSSSGTWNVNAQVGITNFLSTTASTSTTTGALVVSGGVGIAGAVWALNYNITPTTTTYSATTDLDMLLAGITTVTLTGNITFTSSNRAAGRSKTIRIIGDSSSRTLTFPVGWKFVGAAAPTSLAANKIAVLTVTFFGSADTDAVAAYSAEV